VRVGFKYGYFVSKGAVEEFVPCLLHEEIVYYKRLQPIQGIYAPVYLGAINLRETSHAYNYGYDVPPCIPMPCHFPKRDAPLVGR